MGLLLSGVILVAAWPTKGRKERDTRIRDAASERSGGRMAEAGHRAAFSRTDGGRKTPNPAGFFG